MKPCTPSVFEYFWECLLFESLFQFILTHQSPCPGLTPVLFEPWDKDGLFLFSWSPGQTSGRTDKQAKNGLLGNDLNEEDRSQRFRDFTDCKLCRGCVAAYSSDLAV
jgi:hypothetical protein